MTARSPPSTVVHTARVRRAGVMVCGGVCAVDVVVLARCG
jgi:hypothetical protein